MSLADPPPLRTRFWKIEDPLYLQGTEAESVRFDMARDESNIKALGTLCYVLGFLWSLNQFYYLTLFFLHLRGVVFAPWIATPYWFVLNTLRATLVALAVFSGYGLRGLRPWSLKLSLAFGLVYLFNWSLQCFADLLKGNSADALLYCIVGTFVLIPLSMILRPSLPSLLSSEYASVIEQTSYIRIRARLPLGIKLMMLLVALVTIVLTQVLYSTPPPIGAPSV